MMETPNILVLTEERAICDALSQIRCRLWVNDSPRGSMVEPSGRYLLDHERHQRPAPSDNFGESGYEVLIIDLQGLDKSGVEQIEKVISRSPKARIIGIGHRGKQLCELGFFRCFQKPVAPEVIACAVRDALEIRAMEQVISAMAKELDRRGKELEAQRRRMENLDRHLLRSNEALSVLAENIRKEREELERRVGLNLHSIIIPSVEKLKRIKALEPYWCELDLIISQIEDFTSGFITDAKYVCKLSPTELRVASLIRNGLNTREIANRLHICLDTIRCHRKKIRKKLGINRAGYSLQNFLTSKTGGSGNCSSLLGGDEHPFLPADAGAEDFANAEGASNFPFIPPK